MAHSDDVINGAPSFDDLKFDSAQRSDAWSNGVNLVRSSEYGDQFQPLLLPQPSVASHSSVMSLVARAANRLQYTYPVHRGYYGSLQRQHRLPVRRGVLLRIWDWRVRRPFR